MKARYRGEGRRGPRLVTLALAGAALLLATPGMAQEDHGLTFFGGLGYETGGPGQDLVDALAAAGLDEARPGVCAGPLCQDSTYHPFHYREGLGIRLLVGARFRFNAPLSVEVTASNGQRGHAEGYREDNRDHLIVSYSSYVFGSELGLHLGPVRLGAGPALLATSWTAAYKSTVTEKTSRTTTGATASVDVGVRLTQARLSLRASWFGFEPSRVPNPLGVPIRADYQAFAIGFTVRPTGR